MASGSSYTTTEEIEMISEEVSEASGASDTDTTELPEESGPSNAATPDITSFFHIIDIISQEFPEVELGVTQECCIYKVPESLRNLNPEAYTPQFISIGPIHRDDKKFEPMKNQKRLYFRLFWERLDRICRSKFAKFRGFLVEKEDEIRSCYSQTYPELSTFEFVEMILLDAVFIMELFIRKSNKDECKNDYMFEKAWLQKRVELDLLVLENQLPIFILKELYKVVPQARKNPEHADFLHLAREYFLSYDPQTSATQPIELKSWTSSSHFTDLIRYFFIPLGLSYDGRSSGVLMTATKLREAGISFEPVKNKCLLDLKFKKSSLDWLLCLGCIPAKFFKARFQLPILQIEQFTECVVRNIMAFEQCHYPDHLYMCQYFSIIDDLIHSKEDVQLLVEKRVIVHGLGSHKEVVTLVNKLCKNVVLTSTSTCYGRTIEKLNKHYYNSWYHLMGKLRFQYCGDLWRASATVAGLLLLIFATYTLYHNIKSDELHSSNIS